MATGMYMHRSTRYVNVNLLIQQTSVAQNKHMRRTNNKQTKTQSLTVFWGKTQYKCDYITVMWEANLNKTESVAIFSLFFFSPEMYKINPGPNSPFSHRPPRFSNEIFTLYSLNIRSLLNTKNSTALTDLASCSCPPDLNYCLTRNQNVYLFHWHPYFLLWTTRLLPPQLPSNNSLLQVCRNLGWRLCLPDTWTSYIVLNSSRHTFKSFECSWSSSITLQMLFLSLWY